MSDIYPALLLLLGGLGVGLYVAHKLRVYTRMGALFARLNQLNPLFCQWPIKCRRIEVGERYPPRWQRSILVLTETDITVYPQSRNADKNWTFQPSDLRWFGRPTKYTYSNNNELWVDFEVGGRWHILKVRTHQDEMMALVRAFKAIATEEQIKAYRRRRPYIRFGPIDARPAEQDSYGVWTLSATVQLFLNPFALVVMQQGRVTRTLPLLEIDKIAALERRDTPNADGLVRFRIQNKPLAFTLPGHEEFAKLLALAAKRSLEEPLLKKGKKEDLDTEPLYEDVEDQSLELLTRGFVIGDDGEIQIRA